MVSLPLPKVSVCLITYNQRRFIAQAIESAQMQRTCFPVEVVIGDDCSKDGTAEIVASYALKYPQTIRAFFRPQNLGMTRNLRETFEACRGEYVALLEGDDYWTCAEKLQRQSTYMNEHPECALSFHKIVKIHENASDRPVDEPDLDKDELNISDLISRFCINTCSVMVRRGALLHFPAWAQNDFHFCLLHAEVGSLRFIPETMAVYRVHKGGAWQGSSGEGQCKMALEAYRRAGAYLRSKHGRRYSRAIDKNVGVCRRGLARHLVSQGRRAEAVKVVLGCVPLCLRAIDVLDNGWAMAEVFSPGTAALIRKCRAT